MVRQYAAAFTAAGRADCKPTPGETHKRMTTMFEVLRHDTMTTTTA